MTDGRAVPAGLSTQHKLAAPRDGAPLALLLIAACKREGKDEAYGEVDVDCPFQSGLLWKWLFLGGCNGEEQEQVLVGAGGVMGTRSLRL